MRRAIAGHCRFDGEPVGCHGSSERLVGNLVNYATEHEEQPPLVAVGAQQDVNIRTVAGGNTINWTGRDDVAIQHWLPRRLADRHLGTPALWVGTREEIKAQRDLGLYLTLEGHCRDRLARGRHAQLLG